MAVSGNQDFNGSQPTTTVATLEALSGDTSIFTSPSQRELPLTSPVPPAEVITTPTISAETSISIISPLAATREKTATSPPLMPVSWSDEVVINTYDIVLTEPWEHTPCDVSIVTNTRMEDHSNPMWADIVTYLNIKQTMEETCFKPLEYDIQDYLVTDEDINENIEPTSDCTFATSNYSGDCLSSIQYDGEEQMAKKLTTKRKCFPNKWKQKMRKLARNSGKPYISSAGKPIEEKKVQNVTCNHDSKTFPAFKCCTFSAEDRHLLFREYWDTHSYERQRYFISSAVYNAQCKSHKTAVKSPLKNVRREYYFTLRGERLRVCKHFFISNLDICCTTI